MVDPNNFYWMRVPHTDEAVLVVEERPDGGKICLRQGDKLCMSWLYIKLGKIVLSNVPTYEGIKVQVP